MPCGLAAQSRQRYGGSIAGLELLPAELRFLLALQLQVIEELQEHDPGEQRQPVEVAVQPLVLAHDVAGGLEEAAEGWAVVAAGGRRLSVRAIRSLCGVEETLQFVHCVAQLVRAAEAAR